MWILHSHTVMCILHSHTVIMWILHSHKLLCESPIHIQLCAFSIHIQLLCESSIHISYYVNPPLTYSYYYSYYVNPHSYTVTLWIPIHIKLLCESSIHIKLQYCMYHSRPTAVMLLKSITSVLNVLLCYYADVYVQCCSVKPRIQTWKLSCNYQNNYNSNLKLTVTKAIYSEIFQPFPKVSLKIK